MLTNISFDNCLLGQFSAPIQTQFTTNNHIILSIWEGDLITDAELQKIHTANFNATTNSYEGQWIKSNDPNIGLVGMGKRELVRYVFTNFSERVTGNSIYERVLRFSKTTDLVRAKATGTAQMFSLCVVNADIDATASVNANNRSNFLIFGSCGDSNSVANLKLNRVNIVQDEFVRVSDITFDFDLTYPTMIFPDPGVPEVPVIYEYVEAIPPMTSYSNSVATITASGEFDPSTYPAWKAFQRNGLQDYYLAAPDMRGGVTPGYTVTSSGNYNGNYLPTRLFNPVDATTGQDGWFSNFPGPAATDANPHWAQIEYPSPVKIDAYVIQNTGNDEVVKALKGALLGSNNGTAWTTLDSWEYTVASTVSLGLRPLRIIGSPAKYKFYRLAIYKTNEPVHSGTFLNYVSIARLHLLSRTQTNNYYANPRMFTITSNLNTDAWLSERRAASDANPYWIRVQFNQPKVITGYRIWNGDKPHMMRGSVQASNDNVNWTTLDTINISTVPTSYTWRDLVALNNNTAYTYYRLTVSQISEWDAVSVGEFVLFESVQVT